MTAKEKVLKIEPDAMCCAYRDELEDWSIKISYWIAIGSSVSLSKSKSRESWAWAEAYRNLIAKK